MATHNWPDLRRRYIAGEWLTLEGMAKGQAISISTLRKRAAKERWTDKRLKQERKIDDSSSALTIKTNSQQVAKIKAGWVKLAAQLRVKVVQTLTSKRSKLTMLEMLRAIREIRELEGRAYGIAAVGGSQDQDGALNVTNVQINNNAPADEAPAIVLEYTDAQLIQLASGKPVAPRVVDAPGDGPRQLRGRAAAPKARKK